MTIYRPILFVLALIAVTACATLPNIGSTLPTQSRLSIAEATVKAIYADSTRPGSKRVSAICFPNFTDPSHAFLARFTQMSVVPCSALTADSRHGPQIVARTGARALTIYVESIVLSSDNTVKVVVSSWTEPLNGGGYILHFERIGNEWKLAKMENSWVG